jgi:hypothetical protein
MSQLLSIGLPPKLAKIRTFDADLSVPWESLLKVSLVNEGTPFNKDTTYYVSMSSAKLMELLTADVTIIVEQPEEDKPPMTILQLCESLRLNFVRYTRPTSCQFAYTSAYKKKVLILEEITEAIRKYTLDKELHKYNNFAFDELLAMLIRASKATDIHRYMKKLPDDMMRDVLTTIIHIMDECFRSYTA